MFIIRFQERKEADKWLDGAKSNKSKDAKEEKRKEELARKAERERLLAAEEASSPSKVKAAPKAGSKKKADSSKPAGPGAIAAGGGIAARTSSVDDSSKNIESYSATGIDDALELLEVVNAKTDKASVGQQAAGLERHPEVSNMRPINRR